MQLFFDEQGHLFIKLILIFFNFIIFVQSQK